MTLPVGPADESPGETKKPAKARQTADGEDRGLKYEKRTYEVRDQDAKGVYAADRSHSLIVSSAAPGADGPAGDSTLGYTDRVWENT